MSKLVAAKKNVQQVVSRFIGSKRQEFVLVTAILTIGLITTQLSLDGLSIITVTILSLLTLCMSALVLREHLEGIEWYTLLSLPISFTIGVSLFYFLLPARLLSQLPIVVLYSLGMYAILLCENIFNVSALRSIQLLRAAQGVALLLTLVSYYLLIDAIISFRFGIFTTAFLVGLVSFFLCYQSLWSMTLASGVEKKLIIHSVVVGFSLGLMTTTMAVWPIATAIFALFIASLFYMYVGMIQQELIGRLFAKTRNEFIIIGIGVLILMIFSASWS